MCRASYELSEREDTQLQVSKVVIYRSSQRVIRGRLLLMDMLMTRDSVLFDNKYMLTSRLSSIERVSL